MVLDAVLSISLSDIMETSFLENTYINLTKYLLSILQNAFDVRLVSTVFHNHPSLIVRFRQMLLLQYSHDFSEGTVSRQKVPIF